MTAGRDWAVADVPNITPEARTPDLDYANVSIDGISADLTVGYAFEAGDPGVHTFPNGDPGYPPTGDCLEVSEVWLRGVNIAQALSEDAQAAVEAAIYSHIERRNEREAEEHLAARAAEREFE